MGADRIGYQPSNQQTFSEEVFINMHTLDLVADVRSVSDRRLPIDVHPMWDVRSMSNSPAEHLPLVSDERRCRRQPYVNIRKSSVFWSAKGAARRRTSMDVLFRRSYPKLLAYVLPSVCPHPSWPGTQREKR